jgi:hypothetical protein
MILDVATAPTIVITGAWNVPIFTPPWMGKHLFGYANDVEFPVAQLLSPQGETNRFYIRNLGVQAEPTRLCLFLNGGEQEFVRLEGLLTKILATLPHTPLGALGVNFRLIAKPASDEVLDKLDTHEQLSTHYEVTSTRHITRIQIDADWICNVDRRSDHDGMTSDFNFHFEKFGDVDDKAPLVQGVIAGHFERAKEFMSTIYQLNGVNPQTVDFQEMGNWEN